ncbi:hypothetical protein GCM10010964_18480 [Caldovatus sediminis]|uniref:Uncharacterized protein n=1 Tax=Caldovatus sediminis TaxID=2041189 RepID=A0A8J2ZB92_9PROT|nr:hypothetical protein [Caldovatus sediminis]GGG30863.1 hypothetical protein GCM10010964_18480 [Caldovatus sediminis]
MPRLHALLGAAVLVLGLCAWAQAERAGRLSATARAEAAERVARANAEALAALRREREATVAALAGVAQDIAERAARAVPIRRAVHAAPTTAACLAAPAVRAVVDGLRAWPAGDADGGPGAAGGTPALQAAAAAAR